MSAGAVLRPVLVGGIVGEGWGQGKKKSGICSGQTLAPGRAVLTPKGLADRVVLLLPGVDYQDFTAFLLAIRSSSAII